MKRPIILACVMLFSYLVIFGCAPTLLRTAYKLSEVDVPPRLIRTIDPVYPVAAKTEKIQGKVTLRFIVTTDGRVVEPSVVRDEPSGVFNDSALKPILGWRFRPAIKDGKPVDVIIIAPLKFELVEHAVIEKEQRPLSTHERIGTEEVAAALADHQAAWQEQDVDRMVAIYSEDWRNSYGVDKPGLRAYFESLVAQDAARSAWVGMGEVVVNGDRATVMSITYDLPRPRGRESYRFSMKKEADGVWRFVYDEPVHWTCQLLT